MPWRLLTRGASNPAREVETVLVAIHRTGRKSKDRPRLTISFPLSTGGGPFLLGGEPVAADERVLVFAGDGVDTGRVLVMRAKGGDESRAFRLHKSTARSQMVRVSLSVGFFGTSRFEESVPHMPARWEPVEAERGIIVHLPEPIRRLLGMTVKHSADVGRMIPATGEAAVEVAPVEVAPAEIDDDDRSDLVDEDDDVRRDDEPDVGRVEPRNVGRDETIDDLPDYPPWPEIDTRLRALWGDPAISLEAMEVELGRPVHQLRARASQLRLGSRSPRLRDEDAYLQQALRRALEVLREHGVPLGGNVPMGYVEIDGERVTVRAAIARANSEIAKRGNPGASLIPLPAGP